MQLMRPVIWLSRIAGDKTNTDVRDFRPANEVKPVTSVETVIFSDASTEKGEAEKAETPDPKGSSATEPASTSPKETPSSPSEPSAPPVDVAKVKIQHPSSMTPGKQEPPVEV